MKSTHNLKISELDSRYVNDAQNPILFANKNSRFLSEQTHPISIHLHNLINDLSVYDLEIQFTVQKLARTFNMSFSTTPLESEPYIGYLKIQRSFLRQLKTTGKEFNIRRFIIGLITGYVGENDVGRSKKRQDAHNSSQNLYLTLHVKVEGLDLKARFVIERIIISLLNVKNTQEFGNNKCNGSGYSFDNLSAIEHVYFGLHVIKSAYEFTLDHFNLESFETSYDLLDISSQEIPPLTQDTTIDTSDTAIESISNLVLGKIVNIRGLCVSKSTKRRSVSNWYFQFELSDDSGRVKIQCTGDVCEALYNLIDIDDFYLIRDAKLINYLSNNIKKERIEINNTDQLIKSRSL